MLKEATVRHRRSVLSVCVALALVSLNGPAAQQRAQANGVQTNGIVSAKAIPWGGGHVTTISAQPGTSGNHLMAAGDVAGVQWSTNGGYTWAPQNDGLAQGQTPIAAIGWGATETTRAWIAYGNKDDTGECSVCGLATATVNGEILSPWTTLGQASNEIQCASDGKVDATTLRFQGMKGTGDQTADPGGRAVGSLVVDDGGGRLFAGTLDGLYVSTANDTYGFALGDCWKPVWNSGDGHVIRSLIQDPTAADTFFAGTNNTGVWRITYHPDGSPPDVKQFNGYTAAAEELTFNVAGTKLYCACGPHGVWRSTNPRGINPALSSDNRGVIECAGTSGDSCASANGHTPYYSAIAAITGGGVWVGASDPVCPQSGLCHALFRFDSGTDTWTAGPAVVDTTILGDCGDLPCPPWWLKEFQTARMLGLANGQGESLFIPTV